GYVCAPILPDLADALDLPLMVKDSTDPNRTAYTISVDSADPSITTGISAHDRALTCRTLASANVTKESFRRPGHIIPLRARKGGVRERRGHTEAAVDFCRLAGKPAVGVIGEIVEDGIETEGVAERSGSGMMRRDGCLKFGQRWGLKVCTIEDLVDYLEKTEGKLPSCN
ncbi:3,4-dihydroxy 2-butanone 4-phosphate synthase, partial [Ascosphaera atra]